MAAAAFLGGQSRLKAVPRGDPRAGLPALHAELRAPRRPGACPTLQIDRDYFVVQDGRDGQAHHSVRLRHLRTRLAHQ